MTLNDKTNTRYEFFISKSVRLEDTWKWCKKQNRLIFHSRHFGFGNNAIRDLMVDKHLGDFSCPGTH